MQVIATALKIYARIGRLPVLGCEISEFLLYCPIVGSEALGPWDTIGSVEGWEGGRQCSETRPAGVGSKNKGGKFHLTISRNLLSSFGFDLPLLVLP
ncbi:hypothetical protein K1719_002655 [Acacia pycnantha]|nr:hypothetical protein K1719_002655 [Acacia pycnantha]